MTTPASTVWGSLQARDPLALIDFLVALGFERTVVYADDDDPTFVQHAQVDWPEGGGVMLGSHKPGNAWSREPGTAGFYVVTADPGAVHERALAAGARIIVELAETDYDAQTFSLADPEGNLWSFGTYPGAPRAS
jgi:uncharacterized glyoxalase superfamily protein PhnB